MSQQNQQKKESKKAEKAAEKEEGEDLAEKAAEYKDTLQHLQAEFENFKKRVEKENLELRKYATAELIKKLLPILDSFELAVKNTADKERFVKGVELIYAQLSQLLEEQGLKRMNSEGQQFDPYKHEVLLQVESEKDGIVLEELQRGYMLNDLVLRHSKVKVGKKKEVNGENNGEKDES